MTDTITIAEQFRGPPNSGNGGYVGGAFSRLLDPTSKEAIEVTLRSPIPLDKALQVARTDASVTINDGDTLIAEVQHAQLALERPDTPDWDETLAAAHLSYSFSENINDLLPGRRGFHPICFCCGAEHDNGARVFAAPVAGQVAAIWDTQSAWANEDGRLPIEYLWTALDCPGQFAWMGAGIRTGLLGRITAQVFSRPVAGESLLVHAWTLRIEGKKHFAGSAVVGRDGTCHAQAQTLWIGNRNPATETTA